MSSIWTEIKLTLEPETYGRLKIEAEQHGMTATEYVYSLIYASLRRPASHVHVGHHH